MKICIFHYNIHNYILNYLVHLRVDPLIFIVTSMQMQNMQEM